VPINEAQLNRLARREANEHAALTLPALALVGIGLVLPVFWLLWQSFIGRNGWTLDNYLVVFHSGAYLTYLKTTFELSFFSTLLCIVLAYPFCYAMVVLRKGFALTLQVCVGATFFASYLVRTYSWLLLLQRRGILNTFLIEHKIIEEPLRLVYNIEGTLLGMVHILLPLMAFPLFASMRTIDRNLVNAAVALGATPARAFRDIFLPLSLPGVLAGSVLVFVLSLGFFLTPAIMGGGRVVVWATAIATAAEENSVWGASSALGIILLVLTFSVLYLLKRLFRISNVLQKST
jgi:ABC-type spermidine/putrescine transport system permease subunit I